MKREEKVVRVRGNVRFMFLATVLIISGLAALGVFTVFPQGTAEVAIEPSRVENNLPTETFTVDIEVTGAEDIQGWDANITFDPSIIEAVDASEGEFIKRGAPGGATFFDKLIDNERGGVFLGASYYIVAPPGSGVTGDGILANITFQVMDIGNSPIHFREEEYAVNLWYNNGTDLVQQPQILHQGFFTNLHDLAITSVTVSPNQVNPGDQVSINVTVLNQGDFTETFGATTFQSLFPFPDSTDIDTKTGETVEAGKTKTLEFTWDTTGKRSGIYNISAEVPPVPLEVDTVDNGLTSEDTVTIPGAPVAFFTHTPEKPTPIDTIVFDASLSYDPDDPVAGIVSYMWDFGDGTVEFYVKDVNLTDTANHKYAVIGTYDVNVTVTDTDNSTDVYEKTLNVSVAQPPVASFTCTTEEPLINRPVAFDASGSYDPDGEIISYEWDFGDGIREIYVKDVNLTDTAAHVYPDAGTYTVNLTVTDNHLATDSFSDNVTVTTKRDIAVVSVACYRPYNMKDPLDQAYVGETLNISVLVRNEGTQSETFNLTVQYDDTFIEELTTKVEDLPPGDQAPLNRRKVGIFWDTTPLSTGNYTITVESVLDEDEDPTNDKATTKMKMDSADVAVTNVIVSPTTVLAGDLLNITVSVKNEGTYQADCRVKIYFSNDTHSNICPTGSTELTQRISIQPDEEKTAFFKNWNLTKSQLHEADLQNVTRIRPGTYILSAEALRISKNEYDLDDNLYIYGDVTIGTSLISIFTPEDTVTVGSATTINGSITPARHGANVTIWYRLSGNETWNILENLTTYENSTYVYEWTPDEAGTYYLKASWLGDNMTLPDESDVLEISVQEVFPVYVIYIAAGVAAVVVATVAIYFLKIRKVEKPAK